MVTELPFMVKKGGDSGVIKKIADLAAEKKLTEISDVQDHSDRNGMRIVIELKRDANPKVVLNKLYKHTPMQTTFGVNMVALVENVPRLLSLRDVIRYYIRHQREVVVRRSKHELRGLERRVHVLEGLLIALDNLDAVIALIRASRDRDTARTGLMERFEMSEIQARAVLDLRLQQLTGLEANTLRQEHADKMERIRELRELLGNEDMVLELIKTELQEVSDRYGDERRTKIAPSEDDIDIEDLIADQQMVISITNTGYIKSLPLATYRAQRRGGVGIIGMDMKDEDFIEHLFVSSTHDYLLFFTNRGKVYRSKVYDLPEMSRTSKGRFLGNVLPLREGERVQSVLATRDFSEAPYVMFATRNGTVKKTAFQAYNTPIRADGIIAINIRDDDELVAVRRVDEDDEILMVSHAGLAVRFKESDARAMGRDTSGVRGMDVADKDNYVLAMDVARPGPGPAGRHRGRLRQAHVGRRVPAHVARRQGRQDDHVHRDQGPARRRAGRARARGARLHLPERHGPAHVGARDQPLRPRLAGREGDEPARGRSGLGGRAGGRVRILDDGRRAGRRAPARDPDRRRGPRRARMSARTPPRRTRLTSSGGGPPPGSLLFESPEKGGGPKLSDSSCGTLEVPGR